MILIQLKELKTITMTQMEKTNLYELRNIFSSRIAGWKQRADKLGVASDQVIDSDIIFILNYWDYKCVYCNKELDETWQMDHAIPLNEKYADDYHHLNKINNLLPSCAECNLAKSDKPYWEFASEDIIDEIDYYFSTIEEQ